MNIYLVGHLRCCPNTVVKWGKAKPIKINADLMLRLMLEDGFSQHETTNGIMLLKHPDEDGYTALS